jgi:hypothetical protein
LAEEAAWQMITYANIPTEKHILYLFNETITSYEESRDYLAKVIAARKELGQ